MYLNNDRLKELGYCLKILSLGNNVLSSEFCLSVCLSVCLSLSLSVHTNSIISESTSTTNNVTDKVSVTFKEFREILEVSTGSLSLTVSFPLTMNN